MEQETSGKRLAALEGRPGVSSELLALETKLMQWRGEMAEQITSHYPESEPDAARLNDALEKGSALGDVFDPLPKTSLLATAAVGLLETIKDSTPAAAKLSAWIDAQDGEAEREAVLTRWFQASWKRDTADLETLAAEAKIEPDVLAWAGRQLARPFFHRLAQFLAAHPAFTSRQARSAGCPSCGGPPRMGRYGREEGQRFLWCNLCNLQWPFPRVTCAFCLNDDQKKLGYLTFEGIDHYRIDVCEVCRGYLRAVAERDLPEGARVDFTIEDVGTCHLGLAAEKQGYQPGELRGAACGSSPPG